MSKITSSEIYELYTRNERDYDITEYVDASGIQVVRNYKNPAAKFSDKKMFIKFYINENNLISVGVDMVEKSRIGEGWSIVNTKDYRGISNYMSFENKDLTFNSKPFKIFFKDKGFTINEFVDFLEKNHHRNMYLKSRFKNYIINKFLHIIFFCVDRKYDKLKYLYNEVYARTEPSVKINIPEQKIDPLFRFFYLHKNMFSFILGLGLPITWYFSNLESGYDFSIQNPFLIFLTMSTFLVVEGLGKYLVNAISNKDSFVVKLAKLSLQEKGKLK